MKPSLQFRLSQHLTLTPQLQQSIRLLQLSTVELNQEIERLLMENPALEREDARGRGVERPARRGAGSRQPPAAEPRRRGARAAGARLAERGRGQLARRRRTTRTATARIATPDTPTLRDHLRAQLSLTNLGARDRALRRAADRRARRGRLPHAAAGGDRGDADAASPSDAEAERSRSWRSRCATCSTSSPPASARARPPSACRLQIEEPCRTTPVRSARAARSSRSTSSCSRRATTRA